MKSNRGCSAWSKWDWRNSSFGSVNFSCAAVFELADCHDSVVKMRVAKFLKLEVDILTVTKSIIK